MTGRARTPIVIGLLIFALTLAGFVRFSRENEAAGPIVSVQGPTATDTSGPTAARTGTQETPAPTDTPPVGATTTFTPGTYPAKSLPPAGPLPTSAITASKMTPRRVSNAQHSGGSDLGKVSTILDMYAMSPEKLSLYSQVIAEVTVNSISDPEFNTPSGDVPTTTLDVEHDNEEWNLWRLAVLDVETLYAGESGTTVLVVPMLGGEWIGPTGDTFSQHVSGPDYLNLEVDDTAMTFGHRPLISLPTDAAPWEARAFALRDQLNMSGEQALVATVGAAYIYDGQTATSMAGETTIAITDLRWIASHP